MITLAERGLRPLRLHPPGFVLLAAAVSAGFVAVAAGSAGGQLVRIIAALAAAWMVSRGVLSSSGRVRAVRAWLAAAVVVWLLSEVARLGTIVTEEALLLTQVSLAAIAVCAAGSYAAAARGRFRPADQTALYLDGAIVALAVTASALVLGEQVVADEVGLGILLHAALFLSVLAAFFLLDISTLVPLRWVGNWEILAGTGLGAGAYVGLLVPDAGGPPEALLHATVGAGALLVGHGTTRWVADEDPRPGYRRVASWLRRLLPVASVALTGAITLTLIAEPEMLTAPLRVTASSALAIAILLAIVRQTVLLADRERVISRERRLADELVIAETQYRSVVDRVPGVVYVAEAGQHGRWHFVSSKIEELVGYTAEEWTADPTLWLTRMHPADRDRMIVAEVSDAERTEQQGRWEYRLIARDGRVVWVIDDEAVISRDDAGRPTMVQGILVDISDRKRLEDQLRHQALHDPLTGLPNRVLFVDRLAHALVRRREGDEAVAVLFVDLDDFKAINDTLGHATGDELLRLVAERMPDVLRVEDTACRMGGDEFAFLLEGADQERAREVATRVLEALAAPFELGDRHAKLSASIGIAIREGVVEGSHSDELADEMLRDADTAMYAAKAVGKGQVQVFERGMNEPIARRRELHNSLKRAIENEELFLEYQPIVDMRDRKIAGVEALVRWNHPQLGRLMPGEFIGLAEETGLIGALGEFVLRRACHELADGRTLVSVNVSAHQLASGTLPGLVGEVLIESGLPPSRLLLELTESALTSAGAGAEAELQAIRTLGVRLALDDFGSGYSSLEYLGRLPVDILKIDRSLVERAHVDRQRQEVLRAIGHIATKLGLTTIVEGVELEAQRVTLIELGFRQAQGFLFAPALPLDEAVRPIVHPLAS